MSKDTIEDVRNAGKRSVREKLPSNRNYVHLRLKEKEMKNEYHLKMNNVKLTWLIFRLKLF